MTASRLLILALALQLAARAASTCPAGAKPFPSNLPRNGKNKYAGLFDISYHDTYKVVQYSATVSRYNANWHPVESMKGAPIPPLVLYQCGTTRPSFGDPGLTTSELRYFQIPVQNASIGWGGPLAFFEMLSLTETIKTIDLTYISSPCTQLMEECVPGVHMSSSNANWSVVTNDNEVHFTDSFGTGWAGPEKDIPFQISLDPGTLHRAEWIRFVAAFFNEEAKADEIFSEIEADYNALKAIGLQLSTRPDTEWGGRQPKVAWISKWGNTSRIMNAHYKRDFTQDAGGRLVPMPAVAPQNCSLSSGTDGSTTLMCAVNAPEGLASFKSFLAEADVIIDESSVHGGKDDYFPDVYSVTPQEVPALARDPPNIFRIDGTVSDKEGAEGQSGSHWFDGAPSQPQQLLAGLMEALWSDNFESPCGFKYLRRVVQGMEQTELGDDDCPYHDDGGSHDCAGIHDHMHEIPKCAPSSTTTMTTTMATTTATTTVDTEADGTLGISIASALAATVAMRSLVP